MPLVKKENDKGFYSVRAWPHEYFNNKDHRWQKIGRPEPNKDEICHSYAHVEEKSERSKRIKSKCMRNLPGVINKCLPDPEYFNFKLSNNFIKRPNVHVARDRGNRITLQNEDKLTRLDKPIL